ncbi:MAG: glycosyltransferase family 2 protein [Planctomycetes bacterium]|nr:glycosyltransferase family 2 protein [Planctomycetota bacterium]
MPTVAVLLLNFRRPELTLQCLEDLRRVTGVALSVLVIDNGSGDGSAAAFTARLGDWQGGEWGHRLELLLLEQNLGFAGGMNRGLAWADSRRLPFVLVLNNDVRLEPDAIEPLLRVLENDARVAAVGPTVLHPDGTVWAEGGRIAFAPNALRLCGHGGAPRPREHGPEEVGFLPCAIVLFRTAELAAIGGFDDSYFMYWEDVELCKRLRDRGGRIVWLPWVRVEHAAGSSSGGARSPLRKYLMARNAVRYLATNGSVTGWLGWLAFDLLLWPLTLLTGPKAAIAKLEGTLAGLRGRPIDAATITRMLEY